jgi:hypothetical protein
MVFLFRSKVTIAAVTVFMLSVGHAQAQPDPNLKPTFGSVKLKAGFLPDPFTKDLVAGGSIQTQLGGVKAHVARAPDFRLYYTKGKFPLTFSAKSAGDTTLLINLPDGRWIADDDSGGALNPLIRIADPPSGRYDIYVGTYHTRPLAATLSISERSVDKKPPPVTGNLPDCYIVSAGVDHYKDPRNNLHGCLNDARNTAAAFKAQEGRKFGRIKEQVLLDGAATSTAIQSGFKSFEKQGKAGDYMVLFLSGHGGRTNSNNTWYFFTVEQAQLTDRQILDIGDGLVNQQKNVVVIVDACHCGQMAITAQSYFQRYTKGKTGGMILMLACRGEQLGTCAGEYSTFAKGFADAMTGDGDLNKDGKLTLGEIQVYSQKRTTEILQQIRSKQKQDVVFAWSSAFSRETTFAFADKGAQAVAKSLPAGTPTHWTGGETLAGYGKLSFAMYPGGQVIMVDAKSTTHGVWRKQGNRYTLSFSDGACVYTGTLNGSTLSGTATVPSHREHAARTWKWTVTR